MHITDALNKPKTEVGFDSLCDILTGRSSANMASGRVMSCQRKGTKRFSQFILFLSLRLQRKVGAHEGCSPCTKVGSDVISSLSVRSSRWE